MISRKIEAIVTNRTITTFKQWLESKENPVNRLDVLEYLNIYPDTEEWVIGMRVICSRPGCPFVYKDYLLEKVDVLETPGAWKRVFDVEWKAEFERLQQEAIQ